MQSSSVKTQKGQKITIERADSNIKWTVAQTRAGYTKINIEIDLFIFDEIDFGVDGIKQKKVRKSLHWIIYHHLAAIRQAKYVRAKR